MQRRSKCRFSCDTLNIIYIAAPVSIQHQSVISEAAPVSIHHLFSGRGFASANGIAALTSAPNGQHKRYYYFTFNRLHMIIACESLGCQQELKLSSISRSNGRQRNYCSSHSSHCRSKTENQHFILAQYILKLSTQMVLHTTTAQEKTFDYFLYGCWRRWYV